MRWYDLEPDVCMAISMIECAPADAQVEYAEYIIKLVKERDKEFDYIKNLAKTNLAKRHARWYDKNETISTAFAYLKETKKELQKDISLSVLAYINSAVVKA